MSFLRERFILKSSCSALLLSLLTAATLSFAQPDPRITDAADKYVRPILLVAPDIPKRDPTDKWPIEIRVSGTVNPLGALEGAEFSPSEGAEKYILAIKEVLPFWRFRPAVDDELCAPVASAGSVLVWFEDKAGKPTVLVSVPKPNREVAADNKVATDPRVKLTVRPKVEYPIDATRAKMEGSAELLFQLSSQGEVIKTKLLSSVPNPVFGDEALRVAGRARFSLEVASAAPAAAEKNWCITLSILFCLQTPAQFPSQACLKR